MSYSTLGPPVTVPFGIIAASVEHDPTTQSDGRIGVVTGIERVGVVGSGLMGAGIAEVSARSGLDVIVSEVSEQAAEAGRARITKSLDRAVGRGKLAEADRDAALGRLRFTTELAELADRQLVIEAIAENEQLKTGVFAELDRVLTCLLYTSDAADE